MSNGVASAEETRPIYKRFQSPRPLPDGSRPYYIITILEPERWEEGVNIMVDLFTNDEPISKCSKISSCPESIATLRANWRKVASESTTLVCYEEDETRAKNGEKLKIAGINMTYIQKKGIDGFQNSGPIYGNIALTLEVLGKELDVYKKFNTDAYMSAIGLYTFPHYRGQGVGKELLLARIPLCKSLGLKVTITAFTAFASQQLAEKCGFKLLGEKSYEDLEKNYGIAYPGITTKAVKLMALEIY